VHVSYRGIAYDLDLVGCRRALVVAHFPDVLIVALAEAV
jgi:hypothetical protein